MWGCDKASVSGGRVVGSLRDRYLQAVIFSLILTIHKEEVLVLSFCDCGRGGSGMLGYFPRSQSSFRAFSLDGSVPQAWSLLLKRQHSQLRSRALS